MTRTTPTLPLALALALAPLLPWRRLRLAGAGAAHLPAGVSLRHLRGRVPGGHGVSHVGAACDDPNSDWYVFVTNPDLVADPGTYQVGQPPSVGPGMWELYAQDFDRAKDELANNGLRLSIEWSRIFPTATDGIEGYEALRRGRRRRQRRPLPRGVPGAAARGLEPLVTLNHYSAAHLDPRHRRAPPGSDDL
ncbi:MAG: hypothetical protein MZV70_17200 [Desulfobacterales bacterium]|nr:hypothetical protein [Desulfobacterales bacterium]